MATMRPVTALLRSRPVSALSPLSRQIIPSTRAAFSVSSRMSATPQGPPPQGFRLPRPKRWDEDQESVLDKAGNYFMLTEMMRGMYVVLEQFFRPP